MKRTHAHLRDSLPFHSLQAQIFPRFVWIEIVLQITTQQNNLQDIFSSIFRAHGWSLNRNVSKRTWIFTSLFRNLFSPLCNKDLSAFLRHSDQCLFSSPQNAFCFTNLSHLVLEIFRLFEKHTQNLNTPQNNSVSWDLQMGLNSVFKG